MKIDKPILGKLTQGTIFTSAQAEEFADEPTWGLCITARCDMARDNKTRVFNYLPIVTFDAWLLRDGACILADRLYSEFRAAASTALQSAGKSPSVLDSYSPAFVAESLMSGDQKFSLIAEKLTAVNEIRLASCKKEVDFLKLVSLNRKCAERIMKELSNQQLSGYYFLKDIGNTEHESDVGYVLLLREVHHLPQSLGKAIAAGMLVEHFGASTDATVSSRVFDFAYPTGLIASPWIEHIMQQFSMLFSRIGLPDPNPEHLTALNERIARAN